MGTLFERVGRVTLCRVARDARTGESRAFAFVYMSTSAEARAAIERLSGTAWDKKRIKVEWSTQRGPHKPGHALYQPPALPTGFVLNSQPQGRAQSADGHGDTEHDDPANAA